MPVVTGTIINGKVVLEGVTLPEGALVTVLPSDTGASVRLSPTEEADLMAALDEADREAGTAADDVLECLQVSEDFMLAVDDLPIQERDTS